MKIYATPTAAHVAIGGAVMLVAGIAASEPRLVAWGGAVAIGLAVARTVTLVAVMRIRAAGFEMVWAPTRRTHELRRGQSSSFEAEIRNRDTRATRFTGLRVVGSPNLDVTVEPTSGEIPGGCALRVKLSVRGLRVGYHGIHGLSLEVSGGPRLFVVPLTFANPFGVAVRSPHLARVLMTPEGGRSGTLSAAGRAGRARGDGTELRELRQHQPGDPFRRIAWKASARRGQLVVRDFEREERDVVQLVLDASVELWSGPPGCAPLDWAIDQVSALAARHLGAGDAVGLSIVAGRELARVDASSGRDQAARIDRTLISQAGVLDADRCGWDEADLLMQVVEHLRPIDPAVGADLRRGDLDRSVQRASAARANAPFDRPAPYGRTARDRRLRRYAACFGMHVPARLSTDRPRTDLVLAATLGGLLDSKTARPTIVHVVAPAPAQATLGAIAGIVRRLRTRRVTVRWTLQRFSDASLVDGSPSLRLEHWERAVAQAVQARESVGDRRGELELRRIGVRVVGPYRAARWAPQFTPDTEPTEGLERRAVGAES